MRTGSCTVAGELAQPPITYPDCKPEPVEIYRYLARFSVGVAISASKVGRAIIVFQQSALVIMVFKKVSPNPDADQGGAGRVS
jgi:hypothetical protein